MPGADRAEIAFGHYARGRVGAPGYFNEPRDQRHDAVDDRILQVAGEAQVRRDTSVTRRIMVVGMMSQ
jgi:hypothetical protein